MNKGDRVTALYKDALGNPLRLPGTVMHDEKVDGEDGYRINLGAISIAFKQKDLIDEQGKSGEGDGGVQAGQAPLGVEAGSESQKP